MKLPIPFIGGKKEDEEYYLALLVAEEKVSAVILQAYEGKVKLIGKHENFLSASVEHTPLDEFIDVVDKTISRAEEILPPKVETHKTVFGVKGSWVDKETKKIKKAYLAKLKKLCDSLDLTPIGFMVISEAISNLLQEQEGAPLSAILAEIGKRTVTLNLFRAGNILQTIDDVIEGSPAATVDRLLKHFTIEVLPARIILYDSDTTETLAQQFISHQWSKSLPFLHMPQVTVLPQGFDMKSVTHGAAEQMGLDVFAEDPLAVKTYEHTIPDHSHHTHQSHLVETTPVQEIIPSEQAVPIEHVAAETLSTAKEFGFILDKDVALEKSPAVDAPRTLLHSPHISDNLRIPDDTVAEEHMPPVHDLEEESDEEEEDISPRRSKGSRKSPFSGLSGVFSSIRMPKLRLGGGNKLKLLLFILPVLLLLGLIVGGYLFYTYQVKATVTLSIRPNTVSQDGTVTFSSTESTDYSKNILSAKPVTASVDGSASGKATGTQAIGDKAKGTVTLYNNSTDSDVTITSGTTITSSNGLKFTLDKDADIASASGDVFSGTKPGTTDVSVTASDIGTDYNLPSGTTFSISGNSNVAAKNGSAFSGGTKKTVTVVSKNDLTNLKSSLEDQLQSKATDQLTQQAGGGSVVLPVVLSSELTKATFDKKAGDQAKSVNINGTVTFSGLAYNQDDLTAYAKLLLKNHYASDVTFEDNSVKTDLQDPKVSGKDVTATAHVEGGSLPKINGDDLAKQLSGKSMKDAQDTLDHLPQVSSTAITYSPNLYVLSKVLPNLPKQVSVVVQSN
jgi:hypothetical protein